MYQTLTTRENDFRDPAIIKLDLKNYLNKTFFDSNTKASGAIHKRLESVSPDLYAAYLQCAKLNRDEIKKSLERNTFDNNFHKASYLLGILKRYSAADTTQQAPKLTYAQQRNQSTLAPGDIPTVSEDELF